MATSKRRDVDDMSDRMNIRPVKRWAQQNNKNLDNPTIRPTLKLTIKLVNASL